MSEKFDATDRPDARRPSVPVGDEAEGAQHVPDASPAGDPNRRDPHPDDVGGADDAGSQGRDRENGGWGDRGIGGGRAGGTGL